MLGTMFFLLQGKAAQQPQRWEQLRQAFRGEDQADPLATVRWLAIIAAAVVVTVWLIGWLRRRALKSRPLSLFHRIAGDMGLALGDQWLLVRIARHESLPSPITLMLSSKTLRHHAALYAQTLPAGRQARIVAQITSIDATLFG